MKNILLNNKFSFIIIIAFMLSMTACNEQQKTDVSQEKEKIEILRIDTFPLNASIRALEVVNDQIIWFAGSGGQFGYTEDAGKNWTIDSLKTDTITPHFRAISVTNDAVFLLSIASPALLYKSVDKGANWEIVYREDHKAAFYDAMAFWDDKEGIAMGDPTDGCLSVIITRDGGDNWEKLDCSQLPASAEGEAAFAASNSNISLFGDHVWIVSGGKKSRVFHSPDRGRSWDVFDTPIIAGQQMTGIFTSDFWDEKRGVIFGGNWEEQERNTQNKAITKDGGKTWSLLADGQHPGYRSCVQYAPDRKGEWLMAVGIPGISYSQNGGETWESLSDESFYTLRFGSTMKSVWLAGSNKIGKIVFGSGNSGD